MLDCHQLLLTCLGMRMKFSTCSKENVFNKNLPFRVAEQQKLKKTKCYFWPFWSSYITPGHPNTFNWSSTHSTGPQTVVMLLKSGKITNLNMVYVIYFLKVITKSLPPHHKRAHSTGSQPIQLVFNSFNWSPNTCNAP